MTQDSALLPKEISSPSTLLEFVEWVAAHSRTYGETMDAWRTSCPRLTTWEDAVDGGFVAVEGDRDRTRGQDRVKLTERGLALLKEARATSAAGSRRFEGYL